VLQILDETTPRAVLRIERTIVRSAFRLRVLWQLVEKRELQLQELLGLVLQSGRVTQKRRGLAQHVQHVEGFGDHELAPIQADAGALEREDAFAFGVRQSLEQRGDAHAIEWSNEIRHERE
jgi:hypothetical protein